MGKLNGKVALITGGTSGIGLATAKLFQQEGAEVIATGRSEPALTDARKILGTKARVVQSDSSKLADIEQLVSEIRSRFGRIDVLFVNAGIAQFAPIEQVTETFFDGQFATNVKGAYFTIQRALPLMPVGGSIILNASVAAKLGVATGTVYSATKAALRSFGRSVAAEVAPRKIRVNTVSPGPIATPILGKLGLAPDAAKQFEKTMEGMTAFKRFGAPEEIAAVALFLASNDSSYMTGAELVVDGGVSEL
jgi:NAD(P)-dependent dehydrogenase (short-subunit alcohol dehydrogenase family)